MGDGLVHLKPTKKKDIYQMTSLQPEPRPWAMNATGYEIKAGYIVEVTDYNPDTGEYTIRRPSADDRTNIAVAMNDCANDSSETVYLQFGGSDAVYLWYTGTAPVVTDTLGSKRDSFEAKIGGSCFAPVETGAVVSDFGRCRARFFRVKFSPDFVLWPDGSYRYPGSSATAQGVYLNEGAIAGKTKAYPVAVVPSLPFQFGGAVYQLTGPRNNYSLVARLLEDDSRNDYASVISFARVNSMTDLADIVDYCQKLGLSAGVFAVAQVYRASAGDLEPVTFSVSFAHGSEFTAVFSSSMTNDLTGTPFALSNAGRHYLGSIVGDAVAGSTHTATFRIDGVQIPFVQILTHFYRDTPVFRMPVEPGSGERHWYIPAQTLTGTEFNPFGLLDFDPVTHDVRFLPLNFGAATATFYYFDDYRPEDGERTFSPASEAAALEGASYYVENVCSYQPDESGSALLHSSFYAARSKPHQPDAHHYYWEMRSQSQGRREEVMSNYGRLSIRPNNDVLAMVAFDDITTIWEWEVDYPDDYYFRDYSCLAAFPSWSGLAIFHGRTTRGGSGGGNAPMFIGFSNLMGTLQDHSLVGVFNGLADDVWVDAPPYTETYLLHHPGLCKIAGDLALPPTYAQSVTYGESFGIPDPEDGVFSFLFGNGKLFVACSTMRIITGFTEDHCGSVYQYAPNFYGILDTDTMEWDEYHFGAVLAPIALRSYLRYSGLPRDLTHIYLNGEVNNPMQSIS